MESLMLHGLGLLRGFACNGKTGFCLLGLALAFTGCNASLVDSMPEGNRQPLSSVELDAMTASGESGDTSVSDASAPAAWTQVLQPANSVDSFSSNASVTPLPAHQPFRVPYSGQFNGINQIR